MQTTYRGIHANSNTQHSGTIPSLVTTPVVTHRVNDEALVHALEPHQGETEGCATAVNSLIVSLHGVQLSHYKISSLIATSQPCLEEGLTSYLGRCSAENTIGSEDENHRANNLHLVAPPSIMSDNIGAVYEREESSCWPHSFLNSASASRDKFSPLPKRTRVGDKLQPRPCRDDVELADACLSNSRLAMNLCHSYSISGNKVCISELTPISIDIAGAWTVNTIPCRSLSEQVLANLDGIV